MNTIQFLCDVNIVSINCTVICIRPRKRSTEKETLWKDCHKATDLKVYACSDIYLGEVLFYYVIFCDKVNRDVSSKIYRFSFGGIFYDVLGHSTYVPFLMPVDKKIHRTKFEIKEENAKL